MLLRGMKISFIGSGIMGGIWIERLIEAKVVKPEDVMACDLRAERLAELQEKLGIKTAQDNHQGAEFGEIIVIAVPPGEVGAVLNEIRDLLDSRKIIISLAAAVPLKRLQDLLPQGVAVVRIMPNTPSLIGVGMNAVAYGSSVTAEQRQIVQQILDALGVSFEVPDELINLTTALCAVGPTYIFPLIDALAKAAIEHGLSADKALRAAAQTVLGAAQLVLETGRSPEELKGMIGLRTLREEEARKLFADAISTALERLQGLERKLGMAS